MKLSQLLFQLVVISHAEMRYQIFVCVDLCKKTGLFVTVTLGVLTAFGPFVTDFYLPFLPEMSRSFHTSPSAVSTSLTAGMVGLAVGQILIGPLSDKYGRKRLLVLSMLLFAVTSLCCVLSPTIAVFNAVRVLQGMAGAGGVLCLALTLPLAAEVKHEQMSQQQG